MDDVFIDCNTMDDHIGHVEEILITLTKVDVTLTINKCLFFQAKVDYLGHMVKSRFSEIDQTNVTSSRDAIPQTRKAQIISYL